MKYLLLLTLLLSGCNSNNVSIQTDPNKLKFKAGEEVSITFPFYSNCSGYIKDYELNHYLKDGPKYYVYIWCPNLGMLKDIIILNESDLGKTK